MKIVVASLLGAVLLNLLPQVLYGVAFEHPQYDMFQLNKRSGNWSG